MHLQYHNNLSRRSELLLLQTVTVRQQADDTLVSRASPSYAEREREGLGNRAHPARILGMYDASRSMYVVATN